MEYSEVELAYHAAGTDSMLDDIVAFVAAAEFDRLDRVAIDAAKLRILDTVGCALGAWNCESAAIAERLLTEPPETSAGGRVIGSDRVASAPAAAFLNGCRIRDLDFNDTFPGGHPSDALGAILAVAATSGASGAELITATVISYEVYIRIQMAAQLREKGWDNGYGIGIGIAAALSKLLHLDDTATRAAISLAATANVPMRSTRAGSLSAWKGAATAFSAQIAVNATELAALGMTGPAAPFAGRHGLMDLITGPIELVPFPVIAGGEFHISRAKIKYWPVVYNLQALVWATLELREAVAVDDLASVEVLTYWSAWSESGSEPAKWDPQTRETADHSLPYIFAWTMRHGTIGPAAFEPEAYLDPEMRPVMHLITVTIDDAIEAEYPQTIRMRLRATDRAGRVHEVDVANPLGHERNPVSWDQVEEKFRRLADPVLGPDAAERAARLWRSIEDTNVMTALDAVEVAARDTKKESS